MEPNADPTPAPKKKPISVSGPGARTSIGYIDTNRSQHSHRHRRNHHHHHRHTSRGSGTLRYHPHPYTNHVHPLFHYQHNYNNPYYGNSDSDDEDAYIFPNLKTEKSYRVPSMFADFPQRDRYMLVSYALDWFTLAVFAVLAWLFYWLPPPTFHFRLTDPSISYPDVDDTIPTWINAIMISVVPAGVIIMLQIFLRNFGEFHHAVLTFLETAALNQAIVGFLWFSVGGLRPSFLAMCRPNVPIPENTCGPVVFYTDSICEAEDLELRDAKRSFPSGHAAATFAAYVFIALYLNSKFKTFDRRAHFWKAFIFVVPLATATWVAFSRWRDYKHSLFDVLFGILIGILSSLFVYKINYCSLFGPDNHVPCRALWDPTNWPPGFVMRFRAWRDARRTEKESRKAGGGPQAPVPTTTGTGPGHHRGGTFVKEEELNQLAAIREITPSEYIMSRVLPPAPSRPVVRTIIRDAPPTGAPTAPAASAPSSSSGEPVESSSSTVGVVVMDTTTTTDSNNNANAITSLGIPPATTTTITTVEPTISATEAPACESPPPQEQEEPNTPASTISSTESSLSTAVDYYYYANDHNNDTDPSNIV